MFDSRLWRLKDSLFTVEMAFDALRVLAVAISVTEMCVLLVYFVPLTAGVPFWTWAGNHSAVHAIDWDDNYVSDLLFSDMVYRQLVTSLVGLHLTVCALFVVRLNWWVENSSLLVIELVLMIVSWIGWAILTADYHTETGAISKGHFFGTGLFVFAGMLYFPLMAFNVYCRFPRQKWTGLDDMVFLLSIVSFLLCFGAAAYFIDSVLQGTEDFAWIFEHMAFIFFFAAHLFLFVLEGLMATHCYKQSETKCVSHVRITEVAFR